MTERIGQAHSTDNSPPTSKPATPADSPNLRDPSEDGDNIARHPVETLAEQYVAGLRHGESSQVEAWEVACPEHEATIRELFPTIAALERLRSSREQAARGPSALAVAKLKRLGDYRLIRELGRGGMGIVYEAEQESLRRTVAVKILPRSILLDQRQVDRFRREAQVAAGLHHTNIVPVFGVGEHEGFHYYVMQCIRGVSLDGVLQEDRAREPALRFLTPETVAKIGVQVAAALHYAHERDVLHGDVKPANLLKDEAGIIWIADFGVAQALDRTTRSAGEVGGTFRYMASEQYAGLADRRSDVYSLGVTLYELLTLRPAFEEASRRQSLTQTLPQTARPLFSSTLTVPRDLRAIIAKAADLDATRRYATAEELGRDLQHFLEGRSVSARRAPWSERLSRWAQRNRVVAALSIMTAALLVASAIVSAVAYRNVQLALQREMAERNSAESNAALATSALDKIFHRFSASGAGLDNTSTAFDHSVIQPVLSAEAAALLQELVVYYEQLARDNTRSPQLARKTAEAQRHVGDIYFQLGDFERAIQAHREALRRFASAAESDPIRDNQVHCLTVASLHNAIGNALTLMDQREAGQREHQMALDTLTSFHTPTLPSLQFALARTHYLMGRGLRPGLGPYSMPTRGLLDDGPPELLWRIRDQDAEFNRGLPPARREAIGLNAGPRPPRSPGPPPGAPMRRRFLPARDEVPPSSEDVAHLRSAGEILQRLMQETTDAAAYRLLWASCLREQASDYLSRRGPHDQQAEQAAFELLEALVEDAPRSELLRYELMLAYSELSIAPDALTPPQLQEAESRLRKAVELADVLTTENPHVPEYAAQYVQVSFKLAVVLTRQARTDSPDQRRSLGEEAENLYRRAIQKQLLLVDRHPEAVAYLPWLAVIEARLGALLRIRGQLDDSLTFLTRALQHLATAAEQPDVGQRLNELRAAIHDSLARTLDESGEHDLAAEARRESQRLHPSPETPPLPHGRRPFPPVLAPPPNS